MGNGHGYQAPSDDLEELVEQVEGAWIWIIKGPGYPGQSPYVDRFVELAVKAAEHGWLFDGNSGLTAGNLTDSLPAKYPEQFEAPEAEERCRQISDRWSHWTELLSAALNRRLLSI